MKLRSIQILCVTLALAGCAQYSAISTRRPQFRPVRSMVGTLLGVREEIAIAQKQGRSGSVKALGRYLHAADTAARRLAADPNDDAAREAYNFAVARIFSTLRGSSLDPWTQPIEVPGEGGGYLLTHQPDARKLWNPALYNLTPADELVIRGAYVTARTTMEGIGAPLVAVSKEARKDAKSEFTMAKMYYGVTAVARFEGRRCVIAFEDPLATGTTKFNGRTFPLAADYTAPLAVMLARENPRRLELARMLRPEKFAETARIVRLQPFDPDKTVVIVTHGLMDTPATWTPMLNALRGDPFIRKNYQFWYYSYPSGYPYPYSAAIMRRQLDAIEKKFPLRRKVVLIGHSMGSMISRIMITDSGDRLWLAMFGKPPQQTKLSPKARAMLEDALIFRHRKEVGRVIFIAGPHRGSDLATHWLGRIGSSLVHAPSTLLAIGGEMRSVLTQDPAALRLSSIPNSVDTLAPNNRFVKAVNTIPVAPGIPYHTICGDRGKGGNRDHTAPCCSDGVVPYWSSHLDGAESELIVPSNHSAHQNPKAIEEVRRILTLHASQQN